MSESVGSTLSNSKHFLPIMHYVHSLMVTIRVGIPFSHVRSTLMSQMYRTWQGRNSVAFLVFSCSSSVLVSIWHTLSVCLYFKLLLASMQLLLVHKDSQLVVRMSRAKDHWFPKKMPGSMPILHPTAFMRGHCLPYISLDGGRRTICWLLMRG